MTTHADPDAIVAAWLDEGPLDLPDATRRAILTSLPTIPQARRGRIPRWAPAEIFSAARLGLVAIVAALALGGLAVVAGWPHVSPSPTPEGTTTSTGTQTPSPQSPLRTTAAGQTFSPLDGNVSGFSVNFTYHLPADAQIIVSRAPQGFWQFRVPDPIVADQYDAGLIVRAVTGGHADPCAEFSTIVDFPAGAQPVMDYLATVPSVTLTDVRPVTIDGRPALEASMHIGAATAGCPNIWLWNGAGSVTENGGRPADIDMRVIDIDGRHIAIYTVAGASWWPTAQRLVDSFRFDAPRPTGSPLP